MKLIKTIFVFSTFLLAFSAIANDRYTNYQAQGEWYSSVSNPSVKVFIKGTFLYAQAMDDRLNFPPVRLKRVSGRLLNEYTNEYIRIQDFNHDKYDDVGVLKSVSYGGSNRCYAIFEYQPGFYSYKSRSTKTVCIE